MSIFNARYQGTLTAHVTDALMASRSRDYSTITTRTRSWSQYAPMTKNNLAVHLEWLLNQGPSLYPSLSAETPPIESNNRASQQPPPPSDETELLDAILEDVDDEHDESMARLVAPSQSSRKPRLVSRPDTWPENSPSTVKKQPSTSPALKGL